MSLFFIYLIQVNIALSLFYLLYAIVLKRDTFLWLRRLFFLSVIVFSFLYPFFAIPALSEIWTFRSSDIQEVTTKVMIGEPGLTMGMEEEMGAPVSIAWEKILSLFYIAVTLVFVLRFISQLLSIYRIRAKSVKQVLWGIAVYQLQEDITPFSFFSLIFIHPGKHSETELSQILLHEQTHARQWHSIDNMLIEFLCLFSWWNPFVWMMKREMAMNLEYLADNGVLREGIDSRDYQYHLLRLTYHETAVQIENNFNVSQLKQRIMMMNRTKSPALKLSKYLLILPLAFLLIVANSCVNRDKKSRADAATESVAPAPDPVESPETIDGSSGSGSSEIFVVVEEQPSFPGGNAAMMKFLTDNIKYPAEAQRNGVQGRVIVNFVVEKDGSLGDFNVVRGIDPLLDNEAVRVLKSMPNWTPGKQRGEIVRVRFTLPVVFRLEANDAKESAGVPLPPPPPTKPSKSDEIFVVVENQPEFPGGNAALMKWISDNVKYPMTAQQNGIQGRVIVNFIVEKDGSLSDIQVNQSVDSALDKEAVRVVETMPKWKPGVQRGEAVRVRYTLPVVFRLQN